MKCNYANTKLDLLPSNSFRVKLKNKGVAICFAIKNEL